MIVLLTRGLIRSDNMDNAPRSPQDQPKRLDQELLTRGLAPSRSRAEEYINAGSVLVNGRKIVKPAHKTLESDTIVVRNVNPYVSRGALKLESANKAFKIDFKEKTVLDIGSSTGGFTQFSLFSGAKKVLAVDVGTDQMHPSLRNDSRIELHEKTDIRDFKTVVQIDIVVMDVSFISLRSIMPTVKKLVSKNTYVFAMCKPQFEAGRQQVNKGVIKNDKIRRSILNDFEDWLRKDWLVINKVDSATHGEKGNVERFFLLRKI